jgi:hypothetical protein
MGLVALLALAAPLAARAAPEALEALVSRCVNAYGGERALAAARTRRDAGSVTSVLHPGVTGRIARAYARPGRLRVETAWPDAPGEVRVLDGGKGWRSGQPAQGPQLVAMILQAARLDLPSLLQSFVKRVQDHGTWQHEGKALRVLAIEVGPGLVVEAGIDPATGHILRSRGAGRGETPVEFVTTYSDFRKVNGALVPFREGNWANGRTTGETVLTEVEIPAKLPEGMFGP